MHFSTAPAPISLLLLSISTSVTGAAIDKRLPVPAGYVAAPYYPTPHGGWTSDWSESYRKASLLVSNMTLAEKANITAGTGIFMGKAAVCFMRINKIPNGPIRKVCG